MYLTSISDIDDSWSLNDEEALVKFHEHKLYKGVKKYVQKTGVSKINQIIKIYPSILSGLDIKKLNNFSVNEPLYKLDENFEYDY